MATTEETRYLVRITDNAASIKRYSDKGGALIDSVKYEAKILAISTLVNRMPFFYENNYPFVPFEIQVIEDVSAYSYYISQNIKEAKIEVFIVSETETSILSVGAYISGIIENIEITRISPASSSSKIKIDIKAIPGDKAWHKIFPDSLISVLSAKTIQGVPVVQDIVRSAIPIIYGDFREDTGDWEKAIGNFYDSKDEIKAPILLSDLQERRITEIDMDTPAFLGSMKRTTAGVIALKGYGEANTTYGVVNIKNKYGRGRWYLCPFESIEKRTATFTQEFTDNYIIEIGNMHEPAWHYFENDFAGNMLCIDAAYAWENRSLVSGYDYQRFYFVWYSSSLGRLCCSAMDRYGQMSHDGTTIYPLTGFFEQLKKTDGNYFSATLSNNSFWKRGFFWRHEDGNYYVGTFMLYSPAAGEVAISLVAFDNQSGEFKIIKTLGLLFVSVPELFWADGEKEYTQIHSSVNKYINAVIIFKETTGNNIYVYDYTTSSFYSVTVTSEERGDASIIGCCAYGEKGGGIYEEDAERLRYIAVQKGTDTLKFKTITWNTLGYRYLDNVIAVSLDGKTVEVMGYLRYYDSTATPTATIRAAAFVNDVNDSGQSYLAFYAKRNGTYETHYTALPFSNIYDVQVITYKAVDGSSVFVATSDGVFVADAYNLIFSDDDCLLENYEYITDIGESFNLYTDKVLNSLSSVKLRLAKGLPTIDYVSGVSRTETGLVCKWKGTDSETEKLAFSSTADSIDMIGIYGQITHGSSENTDLERFAMWLVQRAEGKTTYALSALNYPDTINWDSWETALHDRISGFDGGKGRLQIYERQKVIDLVWDIIRQCGHYLYMDFSSDKLLLKYAFANIDTGSPDFVINEQTGVFVKETTYEGYFSAVDVKWNKVRGDYFSYYSLELPLKTGGEIKRQLDMNLYIDNDGGVISSLNAMSYTSLLFGHESNYNYITETENTPLRLVTFDIPTILAREISLSSLVEISDVYSCAGFYRLFQKELTGNFERWTLLEIGEVFIP